MTADITIPRALFEALTEAGIELLADSDWKIGSRNPASKYFREYTELKKTVEDAVAIRDSIPQSTT